MLSCQIRENARSGVIIMYAVFAFDDYYPEGGWDDMVFFGTGEELIKVYDELPKRDYTQIIDLSSGQKVSYYDMVRLFGVE